MEQPGPVTKNADVAQTWHETLFMQLDPTVNTTGWRFVVTSDGASASDISLELPTVTAALLHDTGVSATDGITSTPLPSNVRYKLALAAWTSRQTWLS